jgi:uncharacterized phage-associated protein
MKVLTEKLLNYWKKGLFKSLKYHIESLYKVVISSVEGAGTMLGNRPISGAPIGGVPPFITQGPPYKAKAVANYFLDNAQKDGVALTPMKLQKLIYFAHGWHLALLQKPLIDERIQAWEFGPVIRTVYDEFKGFGRGPITGRADTIVMRDSELSFFRPEIPESDSQTRGLLDRVWEVYKDHSAYQLSALTHETGSPWAKAYSANPGVRNLTIDDDDIRAFFEQKAHDNRQRQVACPRFRRHQVRCFYRTGGGSWRDESLRGSSSLRLFG